MRSVTQTIADMLSSHSTHHITVAFGGIRLSYAVHQQGIVCPGMAVGHQVMRITEVLIIARATIDIYSFIQ